MIGQRGGKPDMIILMRHGESQGNVDQGVYATIGDPNVTLTATGRAQAHDAGDRLAQLVQDRRVAAYTSPYKRSERRPAKNLALFSRLLF